jgi:predicted RNA binding protein YcfA (HicA-like mRNA interferase family)
MAPSYDRARVQRALADFRTKRRSATPEAVAALCRALGYEIDKKRGKGSHWVAVRPEAPPVTIPTGNKVLGLKTATGMLTILEEVFERDGSNQQRQG